MDGVSYRRIPRRDRLDELVDALVERRIEERLAELGGDHPVIEEPPAPKPPAKSEPPPKRGRRTDGKGAELRQFITSELASGIELPATLFHDKGRELGLSANYASKLATDLTVQRRQTPDGWLWRIPPAVSANGHDPDFYQRARERAEEGYEEPMRLGRSHS